jgi:hypothetical protein
MLGESGLKIRSMPRDVSTRWNSTYDMLAFAVAYRAPLDQLTSSAENKLRPYKMSGEEWGYAIELQDALKVRERRHVAWPLVMLDSVCHTSPRQMEAYTDIDLAGIQGCYFILLAVHPKSPHCNPRNGLH